MSKVHYIDPPAGWRYGFPKVLPEGITDTIKWLLENGYPQHEIDACGDHFHCRHWEEDDGLDDLGNIVDDIASDLEGNPVELK